MKSRLFAPYVVPQSCQTSSLAAAVRLVWRKNPSISSRKPFGETNYQDSVRHWVGSAPGRVVVPGQASVRPCSESTQPDGNDAWRCESSRPLRLGSARGSMRRRKCSQDVQSGCALRLGCTPFPTQCGPNPKADGLLGEGRVILSRLCTLRAHVRGSSSA